MRKRISVVLCAIVLVLSSVIMSGCSCNRKLLDLNYKYTHCVVYECGEWVEYKIDSWKDYDDGTISIWTKDGQMIYTHSVNVVMYGVN